MRVFRSTFLGSLVAAFTAAPALAAELTPVDPPPIPNLHAVANASGAATTFADNVPLDGPLDTHSPFFQSFGTNDRSCFACHAPRGGWSITPELAQFLFQATSGTDPMFRPNDGTTSPDADVSTLDAKRQAYGLLLAKGLIRVGLPMPEKAEFTLVSVDDPYHYASAKQLSLFRRPLPNVNLKFLSDVMWDGRQTTAGNTLGANLASQADDATKTHAAATQVLADNIRTEIVDFESSLFLAQTTDIDAGLLTDAGASGGPQALAVQDAYEVKDEVFNLFNAWRDLAGARAAVARGQELFNSREFRVKGVRGFNDVLDSTVVTATCSTCHNMANAGSNATAMRMDLGLVGAARRTADLPLYTFREVRTGKLRSVSDPGRGLITGRWRDLGCFKVPTLRGLAARPPYFHDGSAPTLKDVIKYLDDRFSIALTDAEVSDLEAFLRVL